MKALYHQECRKKALRAGEPASLILGGLAVRLRGKTGGEVAVLIPPILSEDCAKWKTEGLTTFASERDTSWPMKSDSAILIPLVGLSRSPLSHGPRKKISPK